MRIRADLSALNETRWNEIALRFICGGCITVVASLISRAWGPALGGLFLAFPAIFPASATLIEKHQSERKAEKGVSGKRLARAAAGVDAFGAFLGSIGLIAFALTAWLLLPKYPAAWIIFVATLVWATVAFVMWLLREQHARWHVRFSSRNRRKGLHPLKTHGRRS